MGLLDTKNVYLGIRVGGGVGGPMGGGKQAKMGKMEVPMVVVVKNKGNQKYLFCS